MKKLLVSAFLLQASLATAGAAGSTAFTDKIYSGSGTIDLFKNVSAYDLETAILTQGELTLGVDLNENAQGTESRTSIGVAMKSAVLTIVTTTGTYTFDKIYTNTTALIRESGSAEAQEYFTLFGQVGSSQITGSTSNGFDLGNYDDVLVLQDLRIDVEIQSANLNIQFVDTGARESTDNENFFDFSGGFEDFAFLTREDAELLEVRAAGLTDAPESLEYVATTSTLLVQIEPNAGTSSPASQETPAAPLPPLVMILAAAAGLYWVVRARKFKPA